MKKYLSFFVVIAMVLVMSVPCGVFFATGSADGASCVLGNVTVEHNAQEVRVPLSLANNPGIISIMVEIYYPTDYFSLVGVEYNSASGLEKGAGTDNFSQYPFRFAAGSDTSKTNSTYNGVIATLIFEVKNNAPQGYDVAVQTVFGKGVHTINANLAEVSFGTVNGSIRIKPEPTPTPTPTPVPTEVPTATPAPNATAVPTPTPTPKPGETPASPTPTFPPVPTASPTPAPTEAPTVEPTNVPITTATPDPDATPAPSEESTVNPSDATPSSGDGDTSSTPTDGTESNAPAGDKDDPKGCNRLSTAWIIIAVAAVFCAAVITTIWVVYKKKNK